MKANISILIVSLLFLQNIFSQDVNSEDESKVQGSRSGKALSQDEMINLQNRQMDPNVIDPGKTYLSDVEGDLTGKYDTVVYGANNEDANSKQHIMPLIFIIAIVVLLIWIFIQSKNNKTIYPIGKIETKEFEPSKILEELEKLQSLRQEGVITEEEFENLKKTILNKV